MAYRELYVFEVQQALRLWVRGRGYREVARRGELDRKTVRRYVEAAAALGLTREAGEAGITEELIASVVAAVHPGAPSSPGAMRLHCRAHAEPIRGWVDEKVRAPKVAKLLARQTGVVVPVRTLQRFIAEELGRGGSREDTVRVVDPPPGEILEVDFMRLSPFVERGTGRRRTMYALLCVAGRSCHEFLWPCLIQTREDVIEGLEAAWRFFGGGDLPSIRLPHNQLRQPRRISIRAGCCCISQF